MNHELCDYADRLVKFTREQGIEYCDARVESQLRESVLIENSQIENTRRSSDEGIGIRFLINGKWGFCSFSNPQSFEIMKDTVKKAIDHTIYYSEDISNKTELFPNKTKKFSKEFKVLKKPNIENLIEIGLECDKIIFQEHLVKRSSINSWYTTTSKYFTGSDGTQISQSYTDVVMEMIATAYQSGITQSINVTEGGRGGMEMINECDKVQKIAKKI